MSAQQKANLKLLERQAGMLGIFVDSGAFSRLPAAVQRRWLGGVRRLVRSLAGAVSDDVLKTVLAGAAALVIGLSGCTDEAAAFPEAGLLPDSATIEMRIPDAGADTSSDGPTAVIDTGLAVDVARTADGSVPADGATTADGRVIPKDGAIVADGRVIAKDGAIVADGRVIPKDGAIVADTGTPVKDASTVADSAPPKDTGSTADGATSKIAFKTPINAPFGFTSLAYYAYGHFPALADMDADGDLDLITGAYGYPGSVSAATPGYESAFYYKNSGTATKPAFASPTVDVLGVTPGTTYETTVAAVDIDGDGDLDMFFFGGYYQELFFYENTGTAKVPKFALRTSNPFGLKIGATAVYEVPPAFVDIDGDGDLDLFTVEVPFTKTDAVLQFFQNTGTAKKPAFSAGAKLAFGLPDKLSAGFAFADMDGDGDLDMIAIPSGSTAFSYYRNSGTKKIPKFDKPVANPFALKATGLSYASAFVFGDLDGDGDLDIVQGHGAGIAFFENTAK